MDTRRFLDVLSRRAGVIAVSVAVAVAAAFAVDRLLPHEYEAWAVLHVSVLPIGADWRQYDLDYSDRMMNTYVTLAESRRVEAEVAARLDVAEPPYLAVKVEPNSGLMRVIGRGRTPEEAAATANALADVLIELSHELATTLPEEARPPVPQVVETATPPDEPRGLGLTLLLALAVFVGGAVGTFLALLGENLDDRLYYVDEIAAVAGSPVLVAIPRSRSRRSFPVPVDSPQGRAYRRLRSRLMAHSARQRVKVILVCGVEPRHGASTVVANLAQSFATLGRKVLVIDCASSARGQVHFLGVSARDSIVAKLGGADGAPRAPHATRVEKVDLLLTTSGMVPDVLSEYAAQYDGVIIDASAMSRSDDALYVSAFADLVLLVVRQGKTTAGSLADARDQLAAAYAGPVGVVAVGVNPGSYSDASAPVPFPVDDVRKTGWGLELAPLPPEREVQAPPLT